MLRNDEIKKGLVSYTKARSDITNEVGSSEIRESQWQGTNFSYPNIRIRVLSNRPFGGRNCNVSQIEVSFLVFSELGSSQEADEIAGIINDVYEDRGFTSEGITFKLWSQNLIPAIRADRRTWRAEVVLSGLASE
ncbi:MAG: hypothetical protein H8D23_22590 [Candidatus Brocadiales bacterium]|nr:hypothetical protein [Candidatus Brocadiales bacterium]